MEKKEGMKWEGEEVDEQQREEASLIVRKSRYGKDSTTSETAAVDIQLSNGVSEGNGHANGAQNETLIPGEEQKVEGPDRVVLEMAVNGSKVSVPDGEELKIEQPEGVVEEEDSSNGGEQKIEDVLGIGSEAINGEQKPENLVFYDEVEGVGSTYTPTGEKQILKDPEDINKFNIASLDSVVEDCSAIRSTFEGDLERDNFSSSNTQPSQGPFKDHGKSFKSSKEILSVEVDVINEDDVDVAEFDVERVLQKQTTHDLFCPNCNSCITKRVILRKRKRRIQIADEDIKRNKKEAVVASKLGAGPAQSPSDQVRRTDEVGDNDIQLVRADEDERQQGPYIFRCLSCFSFFIPIGNGFKKFRLFGEKNGKDNLADEQAPNIEKNRFTSEFASNKQDAAVGQGSSSHTGAGILDAGVESSSKLNHQTGQPSHLRKDHSPTHAYEGTGDNDAIKSSDEISTFPKQKLSTNGKVTIGQLDISAIETVDAAMEQFDPYTDDKLKDPKPNKEVYISREIDLSVTAVPMVNQFTNGESMEDSVSSTKEDGLKLLISSSNGSSAPENLKDSHTPKQTVRSVGEDKGAIHVSAASLSVLQASDMNGKLNISASAPHEKQDARDATPTESVLENNDVNFRSNEKGEVNPSELSQPVITHTKLELHSGKDAVIAIDPQPMGSSQIVSHPTETMTASQPATQISIAGRERTEERKEFEIEVIKSIVYGGLAETITSLSIVSSAAGGGAATLNILALGMANLIGGLFIILHNLWELRGEYVEQVSYQISEGVAVQRDRYKELLGRRQHFILHATVAIISYLVFGLVPPVVYGLSFRKTDDKQLKLVVVAAAALICITALAIGRAYVRRPPKPYLKSVTTFVILGFMVSGFSYAAGELVERIMVKLGLFQSSGTVSNLLVPESTGAAWASY